MQPAISFQSLQDVQDLGSYLGRAKRLDEDGAVKFRAFGDVLAIYVSPIYSGSLLSDGPTVLGLRTIKLARSVELDSSYALGEILERLAAPKVDQMLQVELPASPVRPAWSGVTPPRQDWEELGEISQSQISEWAKAGIAEVASTLPSEVASVLAAKVRLGIWGKTVSLEYRLPGAAAFAMAGLGFMQKDEQIRVYGTKGWVRLTANHGHVLSKQSFKIA